MDQHYNLYYIILEDKEVHRLPDEQKREIQNKIEKFYREIKPP